MTDDVIPLELTVEDFQNMDDSSYFLIDVRETWEKEIADIGGVNIPLSVFASIGDKEELKDKKVILYCHHGVRSLQAAMYMRSLGFIKSQSLRGGIDYWSRNIDVKVPIY